MSLQVLHNVVFNAHILFSVALALWAFAMAAQRSGISGGFWGAIAISTGLAAVVLLLGGLMTLQGLRPERVNIYFLYMVWLVIIMPGLFTQLRGRDDSTAAFAFGALALFNVFVSLSMWQRGLVSPWLPVA